MRELSHSTASDTVPTNATKKNTNTTPRKAHTVTNPTPQHIPNSVAVALIVSFPQSSLADP